MILPGLTSQWFWWLVWGVGVVFGCLIACLTIIFTGNFFVHMTFAGLTDVVVGFLVGCVGVCEDS